MGRSVKIVAMAIAAALTLAALAFVSAGGSHAALEFGLPGLLIGAAVVLGLIFLGEKASGDGGPSAE